VIQVITAVTTHRHPVRASAAHLRPRNVLSYDALHADEIHTDPELVAQLLAGQFPHWAHLPVRRVASAGTDNALYRLGDDIVVRLPRIHWAVDSLDKEHQWLPRLAPRLPVAIPVPLAKGVPAHGYPWHWSVYRWLDGENPTIDHHGDPRQLAADLASFLTALQHIDPTGGPLAGRGGPLATRDEPTRAAIAALHGEVDTDAVIAAWEAALQAPPSTLPPCWIHADLSPGNVLLVRQRLSAVIDFSLVGLGDPACDLPIAWNLLPEHVRDLFRTTLGIDDATWARGRGWALSIALIQLPYYRDTNPTLAASARHVIREVLTYHDRRRSSSVLHLGHDSR
jgi:aminoglycoside phosphotransferase (APT) family kinase protein